MFLGDAQEWLGRFVSLDERLLQRVAVVWPSCLAGLGPQPEEDAITINLVDRLVKDAVVRRICHWIEYQYEPFGIDSNGSKYSKGKIARIIHHAAHFCASGELTRAHGPSGGIGVRTLAVRRVWG